MGGDETLHRIWILAPGGSQQLIEVLRSRYREDRRVDHGAAPLLPIRRLYADTEAAHTHHCIRGIRVRSGEVEASHHRILAGGEDGRPGKLRAIAVGLEGTGETDALSVVATMAQCRAAGRRQRRNHLFGCQPMRREPPSRVRKRYRGYTDHCADEQQRPNPKSSW
jgi:hypothetical protein